MRAVQIWKAAVEDKVDFLDKLIDLLRRHQIRFCVIGGQGVNAYAAPLISLDLDLVVAAHQIEEVEGLLGRLAESFRGDPAGQLIVAAAMQRRAALVTKNRQIRAGE